MRTKSQFGNRPDDNDETAIREAAGVQAEEAARLERALTDFRSSVQAWSEAACSRPRSLELTVRHRSWRLAAGWALGCVLVAGGVTGAVMQHERQMETAQLALAQQQAQKQQAAEARQLRQEEDRNLMARVDNETAQEVPSAMEPLAQMMEDGQTQ